METTQWSQGWKKYFKPIITDHFCVYPPWEKNIYENKTGICIEPGMAFGTGQHETTFLCLKLLEKILMSYQSEQKFSLLDLGTGSGILAIAAAKKKEAHVTAIDIEKDAIQATLQNSIINDVELKTHCTSCESFLTSTAGQTHHQVIVANILQDTLMSILPMLHPFCTIGTHLILSGILENQSQQIISEAHKYSFITQEIQSKKDWVALHLLFKGI